VSRTDSTFTKLVKEGLDPKKMAREKFCHFNIIANMPVRCNGIVIRYNINTLRKGFSGSETLFSERPDARVASGQFIPRAEAGRAPARPVGYRTGAFGQALKKLRSTRGRSDVVAHQVTINRTRQVTSGCLLESTGCWHCDVRSSLSVARASGVRTLGRVRSNQAARLVTSEHVRLRLSDRYDRVNEI
jgi:hypothetical protein